MPHLAFFVAMVLLIANAAAQDPYQLNPGDLLDISVWREENMQLQVVILPDGSISIPLAGHLDVAGKTSEEVESEIKAKLTRFFPDIVLTVSVAEVRGNQVYVIGEVENPGVFVALISDSTKPPSPSSASPASGLCSEGSPDIVITHELSGRTLSVRPEKS